MPSPVQSYSRSINIAKKFDHTSGEGLTILYQPALLNHWDRSTSKRYYGFITDLRAKIDIKSVQEAGVPEMDVTSTRVERLTAVRDVEWKSPRKQLDILLKKSDSPLIHICAISLLNRYPYYQIPLLSFLSDNGIFSIGNDSILYAKITDVGFGQLFNPDEVSIYGAVKEECTILPDEPREISYSQSHSWNITNQSSMILPANPHRLQLTLTNQGSEIIWLNYGALAEAERGIALMPNGGSYEINQTNPYQGAIAAISTGIGSSLAGLEAV